jgi:FAD/FMN-containing dehydrogenase
MIENGLVIDMSLFKGVRVDAAKNLATARAGTVWAELDRASQEFNLATPGGTVSSTGVVGLTMGGGVGWLLPSAGLSCDNLLGARVLSSDGRFLTVTDELNPDVMWALRGGGYGLGVIIELDYDLRPVSSLIAGSAIVRGNSVKSALDDVINILPGLDDRCMVSPCLTRDKDGVMLSLDLAVRADGRGNLKMPPTLNNWCEISGADVRSIRERSYCDAQTMLDNPARVGMRAYWKSEFVRTFDSHSANDLVEAVSASPSEECMILIEHYHGAYRNPQRPSAFPFRRSELNILVVGAWAEVENSEGMGLRTREWARTTMAALGVHRTGDVYINYEGDLTVSTTGSTSATSPSRLEAVRRELDPLGVFG